MTEYEQAIDDFLNKRNIPAWTVERLLEVSAQMGVECTPEEIAACRKCQLEREAREAANAARAPRRRR